MGLGRHRDQMICFRHLFQFFIGCRQRKKGVERGLQVAGIVHG